MHYNSYNAPMTKLIWRLPVIRRITIIQPDGPNISNIVCLHLQVFVLECIVVTELHTCAHVTECISMHINIMLAFKLLLLTNFNFMFRSTLYISSYFSRLFYSPMLTSLILSVFVIKLRAMSTFSIF